jgi:hypothetical protein
MNVILGPWTADKSVPQTEGLALARAMGDEAWSAATKTKDITPVKPSGKPAEPGFSIIGLVASFKKEPGKVHVSARFTVLIDGNLVNIAPTEGKATATGSMTAEDAVRAVTETKIKTLLELIKSGKVKKAA